MNLKKVRKEKGIGLNKLAKEVSISPAYLSELENGKKLNPSKEVMDRISERLGVSVFEIFYENSKENKGE